VNLYQQHPEPERVECAARECEPLELVLVEGEGIAVAGASTWNAITTWGAACRSAPTCATGCGIAIGKSRVCSGHRGLEDARARCLDRME